MANVTEVESYDEALGALKKGADGIKVDSDYCKYEGNEQSFHKFVDALASNKTCKILDLETNNIGNEGAKEIANGLKANKTLQTLNLGVNEIGVDGAKDIAEALKVNTSLQELDLADNRVGDRGAVVIGNAIRENENCALVNLNLYRNGIGNEGALAIGNAIAENSALVTLNLEINNIGNEGAKEIANGLKANKTLQTLNLGYNEIGNDGAKEVAEALKQNSTLQTLGIGDNGAVAIGNGIRGNKNCALVTLDLQMNQIGPEGSSSIGDALKQNHTLTGLDLRENEIGDDGAKVIAAALKINSTLQTLNLARNKIFVDGAKEIAAALKKNVALQTLNLPWNNIGPNGAKHVADALKANTYLRELNLWDNIIGPEGGIAIGNALKDNKSLRELNLGGNEIRDEGAVAIGNAIRENENCALVTLVLRSNRIGPKGGASIGNALKHNNTLTSLELARNKIGSIGAIAIGKALIENKALLKLTLWTNEIGPEGAKHIADALKVNTSLLKLDLSINEIGVDGTKEIAEALKSNSTLQTLTLGNNRIGPEGGASMGDALEQNNTLSSLGLLGNKIGVYGADEIAEALKKNSTLRNLEYNAIGDDGAVSIGNAIGDNENCALSGLSLGNNNIGEKGKEVLTEISALRPNLWINLEDELPVDEARKQLASKLTSQKTRWGWCKLMVIGEGRAGKTQTIRSLLGDEFEPDSASTAAGEIKMAQIHADKHFTLLDNAERKERHDLLLREAAERERYDKNRAKRAKRFPKSMQVQDSNVSDAKAQETATKILRRPTLAQKQIEIQRRSLARKEAQLQRELDDEQRLYFTMWDFAGQDVYKAIHHLFLTTNGVYLLVFDMSKLIHKDLKVQKKSKSDLNFWIKSAHMYSPEARICFVGTHRDKCSDSDLPAVDDVLYELVAEVIDEEQLVLWETGNTVFYYFPVDNGMGERTESVFVDLRKTLVSLARDLESVNLPVPMKWVLFMSSIWDRKEKERHYMPLAQLTEEQEEFGIVGEEAEEMLEFCHNMGMILHWNNVEALKDTVVLNPQWIIEAAARIMHQRKFHECYLNQSQLKKYQKKYNEMHSTGMISEKLLTNVLWCDSQFKNKIGFLLALFETALLLCKHGMAVKKGNKVQEEIYLIPSLLRNIEIGASSELTNIVKQRWIKNVQLFEHDKIANVVTARLKFSWLPPGLFDRLCCVCMRMFVHRKKSARSDIAPNTALYFVSMKSMGQVSMIQIPVYFECREGNNEIQIKTLSGKGLSAIKVLKDIQEAVRKILNDDMRLAVEFRLFLAGLNSHEFELEALGELNQRSITVVNSVGENVAVANLGLWHGEFLHSETDFVNRTSLVFNRTDLVGKLSPKDFAEKKDEWKTDWEESEYSQQMENLSAAFESLQDNTKRKRIGEILEALINGPMDILAKIWKDALKHSAGTKNPLKEYNAVLVLFLLDTQLKPLENIERWIKDVNEKIENIATKQQRYGIFLSHQGIKMDAHGNKISLMKGKMKTLKVLYQKTIKFKDENPVPVFLDKDMLAGDHQHVAMLFSVCKSDKVMVFLDKDYFSRKWCLMEYFLAKSRPGVIMPFLVDMEIDKTSFPIPLPNGVTCDYMNERSGPDDEKYLIELQRYFGDKDSHDYTDRY